MITMPFSFNVAGVTFQNDDGSSRQSIAAQLVTGDILSLKDCASDKYPESIGVFTMGDDQVGNVPASTARQLRKLYPEFEDLACVVCSVGSRDSSHPIGVIAVVAGTIDAAISAMPPELAQSARVYMDEVRANVYRSLDADSKPTAPTKPAKAAKAAKPKRRGKLRWILILIALFILFLIIAPKK